MREKIIRIASVFIVAIAIWPSCDARSTSLSDDEIKKQIIADSIRNYPGNCPCPYNVARNGSRCGRRSAWSKPGGYSPICYPNEITPEMIEQYRRTH